MPDEPVPTDEAQLYLDTYPSISLDDPDAISADIAQRILSAESPAEILGGGSLPAAKDMLAQPFALTDVRYLRSDMAGSIGVYAVIEGARLDDGTKVLFTCGARNVMAQAFRLKQLGLLPINVKLVEAPKASAQGYRPMWLDLVGEEPF